MRRMAVVHAVLSLIAAIALGLLGLPWCWLLLLDSWRRAAAVDDGMPLDPLALYCGGGCALLLMLFKRPNWFLHTVIHETAHALMCVMLFVPVSGFRATHGHGGEVAHGRCDPLRGTLISIAPYILPLLLIPPLAVAPFVPGDGPWHPLCSAVAAFAALQHLQGLYHNVRLNFSGTGADLPKVGRPLSLVLIAGSLLLIAAWVLTVLW
jgi:hypothetical protein